jgi:ABC-type nickel/cobalt efflux system permease component RcnA
VPPEFAGFTSSLRFLIPIAVSTLASVTVLAMRESPSAGTALRMAIGDGLVIAATGLWVLRRDEWRKRMRAFVEAGRSR